MSVLLCCCCCGRELVVFIFKTCANLKSRKQNSVFSKELYKWNCQIGDTRFKNFRVCIIGLQGLLAVSSLGNRLISRDSTLMNIYYSERILLIKLAGYPLATNCCIELYCASTSRPSPLHCIAPWLHSTMYLETAARILASNSILLLCTYMTRCISVFLDTIPYPCIVPRSHPVILHCTWVQFHLPAFIPGNSLHSTVQRLIPIFLHCT
jgi:hypothetical protein